MTANTLSRWLRTPEVAEAFEYEPKRIRELTGAKAAADYLGCCPKRVYNRLHEIPHVRDGGRLMFNTYDLDDHLRGGRSTR